MTVGMMLMAGLGALIAGLWVYVRILRAQTEEALRRAEVERRAADAAAEAAKRSALADRMARLAESEARQRQALEQSDIERGKRGQFDAKW